MVLFDAPPTLGHNLQRAVDEVATAEGVSSAVTHIVYTHHHSDHAGGSSIFGSDVVRIGHEECRRLLLRDGDPAKPAPEETFADRYTLEVGGERVELAWHGGNHSPDNIYIHFPGHDTLMLVDIVLPAGCRSTASICPRTSPGTSPPRPPRWTTRGGRFVGRYRNTRSSLGLSWSSPGHENSSGSVAEIPRKTSRTSASSAA